MDFSVLINKLFIMIALMAIGYILSRTGYISDKFVTDASKVTINVFMVATILVTITTAEVSASAGELLKIVGVMTASVAVCYIMGELSCRVFPVPAEKKALFVMLIAVMNNVFVGLPVVQAAYGERAAFYIILSNVPFNVILYSYGTYRLRGEKGKINVVKMMTPPLVGTLAAVILFALRLRFPAVVTDLLSSMAGGTMPLSMLVVGASLGSVSFADAFRDRQAYMSTLVTLIISPLAVWAILLPFGLDPILMKTAVVLAGCPSGVVITVLSAQYGKDYVFTSKAILLSTVVSMVSLPTLIYLLG